MSVIEVLFKCSFCSKSMAVDEVHVGRSFKCPSCLERMEVPEPAIHTKCMSCGLEISTPKGIESIECPNCETIVSIPQEEPVSVPERQHAVPVTKDVPAQVDDLSKENDLVAEAETIDEIHKEKKGISFLLAMFGAIAKTVSLISSEMKKNASEGEKTVSRSGLKVRRQKPKSEDVMFNPLTERYGQPKSSIAGGLNVWIAKGLKVLGIMVLLMALAIGGICFVDLGDASETEVWVAASKTLDALRANPSDRRIISGLRKTISRVKRIKGDHALGAECGLVAVYSLAQAGVGNSKDGLAAWGFASGKYPEILASIVDLESGDLFASCTRCGGSGSVLFECKGCGGSKKCRYCSGKGSSSAASQVGASRFKRLDSGAVKRIGSKVVRRCRACSGGGACRACESKDRMVCPNCNGEGWLMSTTISKAKLRVKYESAISATQRKIMFCLKKSKAKDRLRKVASIIKADIAEATDRAFNDDAVFGDSGVPEKEPDALQIFDIAQPINWGASLTEIKQDQPGLISETSKGLIYKKQLGSMRCLVKYQFSDEKLNAVYLAFAHPDKVGLLKHKKADDYVRDYYSLRLEFEEQFGGSDDMIEEKPHSDDWVEYLGRWVTDDGTVVKLSLKRAAKGVHLTVSYTPKAEPMPESDATQIQ